MDYHIFSESVPTLSNVMLILLSLLLFIVAFKTSKHKGAKAGKMFIALIGVTALTLGLNGGKLISDAYAAATYSLLPLNVSASTGHVDLIYGYNEFKNENDSILVIDTITPPPPVGVACGAAIYIKKSALVSKDPSLPPLCTVGLKLPSNDSCYIDCRSGSTGD